MICKGVGGWLAVTLTTGVDNVAGTSGNDTITSANNYTDGAVATTSTFSAADSINGGAGTDTLNLVFEGDFANNTDITLAAATINAVETITVRNLMTVDGTGDTLTFNADNATGETTLASDRSTSAVAFSNVADGTKIAILGNGSANGNVSAAYKSAASTVALDVSGGTTGSTFTVTSAQTGTSAAITSSGASNSLGAIDFGSATLLSSVTIDATTAFLTTDLGYTSNDFAANATVTISGAAADVAATATAATRSAVSIGTLDSNIKTVNASGLTAGGVALTLSGTTQTVTGGKGNDQITTGAASATGVIDAGDGTGDQLIVASDTHLDSTLEGSVYKGFEVLVVSNDAEIDMDNVTGSTIGAVVLADGAAITAITDMTATQGANVTIAALAGAATLGIKNATTVGTNDTLKITVNDGDTTGSEAVAGTGDLTVAGIETIEITATDDLTLATMANMSGITSLKVSGGGDVSITTSAHAVTTNMAVDFSGLTAATTFNAAAATTNALAFTGSATKADTVTVGAIGGYVVSTGGGNDTVNYTAKTGGTSGDTITLGAGADTFSFGTQEGDGLTRDGIVFKFAAGDSVSTAGSATDATNADTITAIAWDGTADNGGADSGSDGNVFTLDTAESATAVTASATAVTFGTTTVANAYDFYVFYSTTSTDAYVYQDTDGDKILEAGEFQVKLVGDASFAANNANDFTISSGNLLFTANDAA